MLGDHIVDTALVAPPAPAPRRQNVLPTPNGRCRAGPVEHRRDTSDYIDARVQVDSDQDACNDRVLTRRQSQLAPSGDSTAQQSPANTTEGRSHVTLERNGQAIRAAEVARPSRRSGSRHHRPALAHDCRRYSVPSSCSPTTGTALSELRGSLEDSRHNTKPVRDTLRAFFVQNVPVRVNPLPKVGVVACVSGWFMRRCAQELVRT